MAILVKCNACGSSFRAKDQSRDLTLKCPGCRAQLKVQGPRVRNHDVFISYSHKDKAIADNACAEIETRKIRCWMAPRDIAPGVNWSSSIIDAIEDSRVMVLIFSSHSNLSQQVLREVERAVAKGVQIVPLRVEDTSLSKSMEYFLSACHWLDAHSAPLEDHLRRLASHLKLMLLDDASLERLATELESPDSPPTPTAPSAILPSKPVPPAARKWPSPAVSAAALLVLIAAIGAAILLKIKTSAPRNSPIQSVAQTPTPDAAAPPPTARQEPPAVLLSRGWINLLDPAHISDWSPGPGDPPFQPNPNGTVIVQDARYHWGSPVKDAVIRATVHKINGQNLSLFLRSAPKQAVDTWYNGGDWFGINSVADGVRTDLFTGHAGRKFPDTFVMQFSAIGDELVCIADGQKVASAHDSHIRAGLPGIRALHGVSTFRNIQLHVLDKDKSDSK